LRAESERRHRLSASHTKDSINPGDTRSGENNSSIKPQGGSHNDFFDARDFRWNYIHQNGRRIRSLAAGYIHADALKRRDPLTEQHAQRVAILPAFLQLAAMKCRNPFGGKS
jgi:hypothetical protein